MVREGGLEPPHPKAPDPKSGASANSATPARGLYSVRNSLNFHNRVRPTGLARFRLTT